MTVHKLSEPMSGKFIY